MAYLFMLPAALFALHGGYRQVRLRQPPLRPMRTLQLGQPVTNPAQKLALARQQGWMAILFGAALLLAPLLPLAEK
ncbi:MAG: hypothetical protein IH997_00575 [Proteobacteria bacterium]|nr:hypothetical protein [Pseudomonadota bacterium]